MITKMERPVESEGHDRAARPILHIACIEDLRLSSEKEDMFSTSVNTIESSTLDCTQRKMAICLTYALPCSFSLCLAVSFCSFSM